ncbi:hypothetical protein [Capybara microvirus Cap1_SP_244]|nr:hypothetical protein [Capybara microvirus Cap1_SP_244]
MKVKEEAKSALTSKFTNWIKEKFCKRLELEKTKQIGLLYKVDDINDDDSPILKDDIKYLTYYDEDLQIVKYARDYAVEHNCHKVAFMKYNGEVKIYEF